jgi:hypothetical protein
VIAARVALGEDDEAAAEVGQRADAGKPILDPPPQMR